MPKKSFSPVFQYVNIQKSAVWRAYKYGGVEALISPQKNKVYSEELKQRAVEDYLTKNYSIKRNANPRI